MPFITKWMLKKVQTKMQGAFDASTQNQSEDNYSQTSNTKTPKVKKQVGEYIDFEEVE